MTVLVVRHAKAGDRLRWSGPDRERPLTGAGRAQAAALVGLLDGIGIDGVLSSPYVRCVETVEPLAGARGLAVEATDELAEGAGAGGPLRLARAAGSRTLALCTHGDVITELLAELERRDLDLLDSRGQIRLQKGSTWVLDGRGDRIRSARYIPPP